jgi:hypothetical protein
MAWVDRTQAPEVQEAEVSSWSVPQALVLVILNMSLRLVVQVVRLT